MANSVVPDQTVPSGAVWSGSTLFAYVILSETLQNIWDWQKAGPNSGVVSISKGRNSGILLYTDTQEKPHSGNTALNKGLITWNNF